jgi:hypothetical protein
MDASSDESLQTFMAITGASIQEARHFVEMAQGDLDAAVGFFLLGHEKQPEQPRAAIAPHRSMLTDAVFEDDLLAPANPFASTQNRALANEHDDRLARIFSPPYNLMYTGHFEAARLDAQQTDKWIMVTIHNPAEFECQKMNRDLWSDEHVVEVIKDSFIFFQFPMASADGRQHSTFYPFGNKFPYICIIDALTGERVWKNHESMSNSSAFIMSILDFMDAKKPQSIFQKKEIKLDDHEDILDEDEQFKIALANSMEFKNESVQAEVIIIDDEETFDPIKIFNQISREIPNEPPVSPESTRIQFRFPDGQKTVRRFKKKSNVRDLFQFLKGTYEQYNVAFELMNVRDPLLKSVDESLESVGVCGASLTLDYI